LAVKENLCLEIYILSKGGMKTFVSVWVNWVPE